MNLDGLSPDALAALDSALKGVKVPPRFCDVTFPEQTAFINDPARFKVLFGPRRIGKSIALARLMLKTAFEKPGCSILYLGLTLDSALKSIWKDGLHFVVDTLGIRDQVTFNETNHTCKINGSLIYIMGADATDAAEKIRGGKYALAMVDEAASFSIDLRELYFTILRPALTDYRGVMCLTGTPGRIKNGLFFDLTEGQDNTPKSRWTRVDKESGTKWSGHRWDSLDNPYQREQEADERKALLENNPRITETPRYQEETLGRWVTDEKNLVYRYRRGRNDFDGKTDERGNVVLPFVYGRGRWHYVLALDLAHSPDAAAICVGAYHDQSPVLHLIEGEQWLYKDITGIAERVKSYTVRYAFDTTIVDGSNKLAVAELNNRHGLSMLPSDKRDKAEFIDLMNDDFIQERIVINENSFAAIVGMERKFPNIRGQYNDLMWDERELKKNKRVEHPGTHQDQLDAALYCWRFCYQYIAKPEKPPPKPGTPEWYVREEAQMHENALRSVRQRNGEAESLEDELAQMEREWDS